MIRIPLRSVSVSGAALALVGLVVTTAAADPIIVPIRITSGTVEVERAPDQPTASFRLSATDGFNATGTGVSNVPGGCDPCFGGEPAGLPSFVSAHFGQMTFGPRSGAFDLLVGGGGILDFSGDGFTLPLDARAPVIFRAPFTMRGSLSPSAGDLGGSLANVGFDLSGSGTGTAVFVPRERAPGLGREFVLIAPRSPSTPRHRRRNRQRSCCSAWASSACRSGAAHGVSEAVNQFAVPHS